MHDSCSYEYCTSDFMVRIFSSTNGTGKFTSIIVLAFNRHEFIFASNSAIRICSDSETKLLPQYFSKPAILLLQNEYIFPESLQNKSLSQRWFLTLLADAIFTVKVESLICWEVVHAQAWLWMMCEYMHRHQLTTLSLGMWLLYALFLITGFLGMQLLHAGQLLNEDCTCKKFSLYL